MYLKIKKVKLEKNRRWKNDIVISMIWLYDNNYKRIKRIKLNEKSLELVEKMSVQYIDNWEQKLL